MAVHSTLSRTDYEKAIIDLQIAVGISPVSRRIDDGDLAVKIIQLQTAVGISPVSSKISEGEIEDKIIQLQIAVGGARNQRFGVNMSGPEFAPWNGQTFPSAANWTYLASKGCGFVRLPVAWESLQPTLGAALNTTYLNSIKAAIDGAWANGISTIVDLHNFAHYVAQAQWTTTIGYAGNIGNSAAGVSALGDATLTLAAFNDVWSRLATALVGRAGLIGYCLMNEPHNMALRNLLTRPNYFGPMIYAPWFTFNSGTLSQLAAGTNPLDPLRSPAWQMVSTNYFAVATQPTFTAVPQSMAVDMKCSTGTVPIVMTMNNLTTNVTATTTWQTLKFENQTPTAGTGNLGFLINAASGTVQFANFRWNLGATVNAYEQTPYQAFAQAAITTIRAIDATTPIYICTYAFEPAAAFEATNSDLLIMTGGNLVFEIHIYFDGPQAVGNGGIYSGSYASYGINAQSGVETVTPFLNYVTARGKSAFVGEFGIPNDVNWLTLQGNFLQAVKTAGGRGTQWFFGSNGVQPYPTNPLNIGTLADDPRLVQMLAVRP